MGRAPKNISPAEGEEEEVLDPKPLRSLAPMFPTPLGLNVYTQSTVPPMVCVTPVGQFPPGFPSINAAAPQFEANVTPVANGRRHAGNGPISATPISAYKTPAPAGLDDDYDDDDDDDEDDDDEPYTVRQVSLSGRRIKRPAKLSGYNTSGSKGETSSDIKIKRPRPSKKVLGENELALLPSPPEDPREAVDSVLMMFDALRRRVLQLDEVQDPGKRADLKAGAMMMSGNVRANVGKRVGTVPGVLVGDIFYFRMEMCIVGLHAPSMGGIDYMTTKIEDRDDSVAICIVSAGGYENEDEDVDTLVYTGQGGSSKSEEQRDQKLERGNLALERSVNHNNEIRVVRGMKDPHCQTGRIYIYDGLYKIKGSWKEKGKSGFSVFKYKLFREPGQPAGIAIWKATQKWIENPSSREKVLLQDLSSGIENVPVCLINEVDNEKRPSPFTYVTKVKYLTPLDSMKPKVGCKCSSVCLPGDISCSCAQQNGGNLPYSSTALLASWKPLVHECSSACQCSVNCRNKVTQRGVRFHFEVFKTTNRGWGLRCWDPIRAGTFICEYAGEVISELKVNLDDEYDDYIFHASCPGEKTMKWNLGPELLGERNARISSASYGQLNVRISAKNMGNISRFMNHSCSPNVFWQAVQYDHGDNRHPHIMFFALKHIPPMTELTYDYGVSMPKSNGMGSRRANTCLCGTTICRGHFW